MKNRGSQADSPFPVFVQNPQTGPGCCERPALPPPLSAPADPPPSLGNAGLSIRAGKAQGPASSATAGQRRDGAGRGLRSRLVPRPPACREQAATCAASGVGWAAPKPTPPAAAAVEQRQLRSSLKEPKPQTELQRGGTGGFAGWDCGELSSFPASQDAAGGQICSRTLGTAEPLSQRRGVPRASGAPSAFVWCAKGAWRQAGPSLLLCPPSLGPSWQLCPRAAFELSSHPWEEGRAWRREGQRCLRAGQGPASPKGHLSDQERCRAVPCQGRDASPRGAGRSW